MPEVDTVHMCTIAKSVPSRQGHTFFPWSRGGPRDAMATAIAVALGEAQSASHTARLWQQVLPKRRAARVGQSG